MRARGVGRKFWGNLLCRSRIFFRDSFRWRYPRAKHSKRLPENQQNLLLESIHFRWMARHKSRILLIGAALGEHSIPAPGTPTQITGKSMPMNRCWRRTREIRILHFHAARVAKSGVYKKGAVL